MVWKDSFDGLGRYIKQQKTERMDKAQSKMDRRQILYKKFGPQLQRMCKDLAKELGWEKRRLDIFVIPSERKRGLHLYIEDDIDIPFELFVLEDNLEESASTTDDCIIRIPVDELVMKDIAEKLADWLRHKTY
jgi:hypothetical protein